MVRIESFAKQQIQIDNLSLKRESVQIPIRHGTDHGSVQKIGNNLWHHSALITTKVWSKISRMEKLCLKAFQDLH